METDNKRNKIFFSSDPHYSHRNVIEYCNRPYTSIDGMNEALISNFNAKVGNDDVTYFLGDMFFCNLGHAKEIMSRLNGRKKLILGNHDKLIRKEKSLADMFEVILPDLYTESIDGIQVVMSHYPLLSWHKMARGAFMLHGHVHSPINNDGKLRRFDVGVDGNNYKPISWDEIKKQLLKIEPLDSRNRTK